VSHDHGCVHMSKEEVKGEQHPGLQSLSDNA
jgi:hypothetical protein